MTDAAVLSPSDAMLSMTEAMQACGLSRSTLQRRKTDLIALGATVSPSGWLIPRTALTELGLLPTTAAASTVQASPAPITSTIEEVRQLEAALTEALRRAEVAEAVAAERQAALERADRALLLLAATEPVPASAAHTQSWLQARVLLLQQVRRTVAAARRQLLGAAGRQARGPRPALGTSR